jgi:hypothetical protein
MYNHDKLTSRLAQSTTQEQQYDTIHVMGQTPFD